MLLAPVGRAVGRVELGHPRRVDRREGAAAIGHRAVLAEPVDAARDQRALAVDQPGIAGGEAHGVALVEMGGEMALEEILVPQVVGIEEADERRLDGGEPAPRRAGLADILLEADQPEARVGELVQHLLHDGGGIVGRGVVDDHAIEVAEALARDRADRVADIVGAIEAGDDDGDARELGVAHGHEATTRVAMQLLHVALNTVQQELALLPMTRRSGRYLPAQTATGRGGGGGEGGARGGGARRTQAKVLL